MDEEKWTFEAEMERAKKSGVFHWPSGGGDAYIQCLECGAPMNSGLNCQKRYCSAACRIKRINRTAYAKRAVKVAAIRPAACECCGVSFAGRHIRHIGPYALCVSCWAKVSHGARWPAAMVKVVVGVQEWRKAQPVVAVPLDNTIA